MTSTLTPDAMSSPATTSPEPQSADWMVPSGPVRNFLHSETINPIFHTLVPGGSHTYSKGEDQFPARSPKIIACAQGAYCWDVDGNRFLDWAMGNRVIILGHAHPIVNEAVKRQIDLGLNFTRPGMLEYELAEYLVDLLPVAEMVKFGKNGSDVTTAAIKLARASTGRKYIACCADHPFFSIHDWFIGSTPMHAGVPDEVRSLTLRFAYNDMAGLEKLFAEHPGEIAAVILEPVKNDAPRDDFLQRLRALTQREGTVLIFDEMISGVRFDLRGAHHLWGVYPDLACFGKAMSNGYSFSLLAGKRELMELGGLRHDKRRVFLLSQTHSSETVGLAACRATLQECQRIDINQHIWTMGGKLVAGVRAAAEREGVGAHVRIIGFDCNPQILCTHEDGTVWPELQTLFHEEVLSWGVLIPWISITAAHGDDELAMTLQAVEHGAHRVRRALETGTVDTSFSGNAVRPVFRTYNRCRQSRCGRLHADAPRLACCTEPCDPTCAAESAPPDRRSGPAAP
ncbi:MAG TPA: glutamate-1-semialdehyde 2,1-aminomutase [Gemmatimonadaceae bacterium]